MKVAWWKLLSLAVEPHARRQSVAGALLESTRARVPSTAPGIYGNITLSNTPDAAYWYRAKGFRIGLEGFIRDGAGRGTGWTTLTGFADNMFFYADIGRLAYFAAKTPTREDELKLAQREMDAMTAKEKDGLTTEHAYRALGTTLLERGPKRCVHLDARFGPQLGRLFAWDKELTLSCRLCIVERIQINRTNAGADREDFCDGCGRTTPDVVVAKAAVDLHFVTAGLCGSCRRRTAFS